MADATKHSTQPDFFSRQIRQARRFYHDLAPPPDKKLTVVCGGFEACAPEYSIDRTSFPYYSLEFVVRGNGSLILDGERFSLAPGAVFTYGPGVSQNISTDPNDPLEKYFVDFSGSRADGLLQQYELTPAAFARVYAMEEPQAIFEKLIGDGLKSTGLSEDLCAALLEYLIVKVADSRMPWAPRQTPAFTTYLRCQRYIAENFHSIRSLGDAAKQCHVDRAYLCRLFRRYDHQTPYQYLMRLKMNLAAERLHNPDMLVKQVAAELHFDDPLHFSRAFKRTFGLSPEAFRKLH